MPRVRRVDVTVPRLGAGLDGIRVVLLTDTHYGPIDRARWSARVDRGGQRARRRHRLPHRRHRRRHGRAAAGAGRAARRRPGPARPGLRHRQPRVLRRGPGLARPHAGPRLGAAAQPAHRGGARRRPARRRRRGRRGPPRPPARPGTAPTTPPRSPAPTRTCPSCCWPTSPSRSTTPWRHGVDLQLSGHTHGGQIWPFHYLVRLDQPVVQGLSRHGGGPSSTPAGAPASGARRSGSSRRARSPCSRCAPGSRGLTRRSRGGAAREVARTVSGPSRSRRVALSEPPPVSDPEWKPAVSEPATGDSAGDATPYLLVMPATDGAPAGMVWPGPEGAPGWAIPVTIPAGTRGYAVFIPLVPTGEAATAAAPQVRSESAAAAPVGGQKPTPAEARPAEKPPTATPHPAAPGETRQNPAPAQQVVAPPPPLPPSHGVMAPPPGYPPMTAARRVPARTGPAGVSGDPVAGAGARAGLGRTGRGARRGAGRGGLRPARPHRHRLVPRLAHPGRRCRRRGPASTAAELTPRRAVGPGRLGGGRAGAARGAGLPQRLVAGDVLRAGRAGLRGPGHRGWPAGPLDPVQPGGGAVRGVPRPAVGTPARQAARRIPGTVRRIVWSVLATVLVLIVFGALLSSADAAFSVVLGKLVPEINVGSGVPRGSSWPRVGGLIAVAAVYTLAAPPDLSTWTGRAPVGSVCVEWAPAIGALTPAVRRLRRGAVHRALRRPAARAAHRRPQLRRVRPQRVLAAARRHPADAGGAGRGDPVGPPRPAGRAHPAADPARSAQRAQRRHRGVGAVPDVHLPEGLQLHRGAHLRDGLRAAARRGLPDDHGGRDPVARGLDSPADRGPRRGDAAEPGRAQPRGLRGPPQHRPLRSRPARSTPGTCGRSPPTRRPPWPACPTRSAAAR